MAMVVQHNAAAQLALGELNKNVSKVGDLLAKVSSGQKINSAKDDSASFCISEKMREQIRTLLQDNQNVQNGSSLFKVADGGINSVVEELRNLKELAINAANDTNTEQDRATIQKEFTQKMANINDIATETNYNGKRLLDGTYTRKFDSFELRVAHRERVWIDGTQGSAPADEIPAPPYTSVYQDVSFPSGTTGNISGSGSIDITQDGTYTILSGYTGTINVNAQNVKIVQENPSAALSDVQIVGPAGGNANLWIEDLHVTNTAAQNIIKFQGSDNVLTIRGSSTLTNSGGSAKKMAVINVGNGLTVQGDDFSTLKINNKDSEGYGSGIGTDEGQSTSSDVSIVNANITLNMFHGAGIGSGGNRGSIGKITVENSTINLTGRFFSGIGSGRGNASCGDIWVVGSTVNDLPTSEGVCGTSYGSIDTCIGSGFASSSCGSIYILDSHVSAENSDSPCIGAGDANSTCSDIFVSGSTINSKSTHGAGVGSGRSSTVLGNITITNGTAITHVSREGAAIGSGQNGRVNKIIITRSALQNLNASRAYSDSTHSYPGIGRGIGGSAGGASFEIIVPGSDGHWEEHLTLEATTVLGEVLNPLKIHHGPKANQHTNFYINDMHTKSLGTSGLINPLGMPTNQSDLERYNALSYDPEMQYNFMRTLQDASYKNLDDISVTTQKNANVAIRVLEGALDYALDEATQVGSYLQRLEYTGANVVTMGENVQSSESTIRDADMAKEMTEYTKYNVLTQSAQSMLAQANQNGSAVLSLLQ